MKKYFVMALAALLPLAFVSCGSDSDDNGGGGTKTTTLTKMDTSKSKLFEGIEAKGGTTEEQKKKTPDSGDFDPNGLSTLHFPKVGGDPGKGKVLDLGGGAAKARKAIAMGGGENPWDFEWVIGQYTVEGNNYTIPGFGVIDISGGAANLKFTFEDGTTTNASATDVDYNAAYSLGNLGIWTCRKWKPTLTRIVINENGAEKFSGQWNDCNLATIATNIKNTIGDFDDSELQQLGKLRYIYFSPAKRVKFFFQGASYTIKGGAWNLQSDNTFSWKLDGNVGNSIINAEGKGTVAFDGNDCGVAMSIVANGGKYTGNVMFKLTPF